MSDNGRNSKPRDYAILNSHIYNNNKNPTKIFNQIQSYTTGAVAESES